jgi:hypothetical protein
LPAALTRFRLLEALPTAARLRGRSFKGVPGLQMSGALKQKRFGDCVTQPGFLWKTESSSDHHWVSERRTWQVTQKKVTTGVDKSKLVL